MALQTRDRDPLLDSNIAEIVGKRGREFLGLTLIALGVILLMMVASYSPEDPSWMSATDAPAQNWLGSVGASIAAPLFMIVGFASWAVPLVPLVWGLRFLFHQGEERALGRLIYAPIWVALVALFAAVLTPGEAWANMHSFGLGGLFGDMALGAMLSVLPLGNAVLLILLGSISVVLGLIVLGFTVFELQQFAFMVRMAALYLVYKGMQLTRGGVGGAMQYGQALKSKHDTARAARLHEKEARLMEERAMRDIPGPELRQTRGYGQAQGYTDDLSADAPLAAPARSRVLRADPVVEPHARATDDYTDHATPRHPDEDTGASGLLERLPSFMRRSEAAPYADEPVEEFAGSMDDEVPQNDRVRARIAEAIQMRTRRGQSAQPTPIASAARNARRPKPLILSSAPQQQTGLPPEPPLQAPAARSLMPSLRRAPKPLETPMIEVEPLIEADDNWGAMGAEPDMSYQEPEITAPAPVAAPQPAAARPVVQNPVRKPLMPSQRARVEAQPEMRFDAAQEDSFELPPLALLRNPDTIERCQLSDEALEQNARMLENVLDDYGVKGEIVSVRPGPVVTMYELEPAPGLKASRVIGLADDIARSMSALSARVSTVPGRSVIGIELPNEHREMVLLRELLASRQFGDGKQKLPLALGKDIGGDPVISNLAKMPHLLIAGTTGSGKSVAINTMILSLLYNLSPDQCRLIMIDPKMLELSVYDGIPHLLSPVVTDPKKAVVALKWVVAEMEDRYRKMSRMGVRNIDGYNGRVEDALGRGEMFSRTMQTGFDDETGDPVFETEEFAPEKMPYIVVIVDEMADLMMVAGKEIEACIQRLAQMARASGIHLIMATQRPSVDVITGTIKANFPTRISFQVTSKIDSRTILGEMGAEQLLGMGDMLYMAGGGKITRCHGPFVSDEEVEEVVNHLKSFGPPEYVGGVIEGPDEEKASNIDAVLGLGGNTNGEDALYDQAVAIVLQDRKCSTSYIQRKLAIGYNKAARLVEQMEDEGVVSAANHVGKREILVPEQ